MRLAVPAGLALALALLLWLSPSEKTLGSDVKVVYLHAALTWVGLIVFVFAGLAAFGHLVTGNASLYFLAGSAHITATAAWVISILVSVPANLLTWGGFWVEPRVIWASGVVLFAILSYLLASVLTSRRLVDLFYLTSAAAIIWVSGGTRRVLHPAGPIRNSPSAAIKLYFLAIVAVCLALAIYVIVWHKRRAQTASERA